MLYLLEKVLEFFMVWKFAFLLFLVLGYFFLFSFIHFVMHSKLDLGKLCVCSVSV